MGIDEKTHEDNQCQCSPEWVNDDRAWKRGPGIRSPLTQPVACEREMATGDFLVVWRRLVHDE